MNGREAAFLALLDAEQNGAYINETVSKMLGGKKVDEKDRALFSALCGGVMKKRLKLDYIIGKFSNTKLKKMSLKVLIILRLGVYQIYFLDKIPVSAACNESVKLAKKFFSPKSAGFVNGILRTAAREKENIKYPPKSDVAEFLSVEYSCPAWICKKLVSQYGALAAEDFLKSSNEPHGVYIRANSLKITAEELLDLLDEQNINSKLCGENMLYITSPTNLLDTKEYKNGLFSIQNKSSARAVEILDPKEGETIIDVCAAPGGKSCAAAEKMNNKGKIYAFDIYEHKTELIKKSALRLKISIINAAVQNGEKAKKELFEKADRVLLDAPCSGIGVIHKKPDIKWRRKPEDIKELAEIQKKLLNESKKYLKVGGILVYSTCTVFKEENEDNVSGFLSENSEFEKIFEEQILTGSGGESGFYICKMQKIR